MTFSNTNKEIVSYMAPKAKHAMGLPNRHKYNDKSLPKKYWEEPVKIVANHHSVSESVIQVAINRDEQYDLNG